MNEETNALIAKLYLRKTSARDFSDWAVSCLEQGLDTKNIRILAAMFDVDSFSEINDYFQRALADLNWSFPEKDECLERYTKFIARQILEKKIAPQTGCAILLDIFYSLEYPNYLSEINSLFWHYEEFPAEDVDLQVIQEAERLISGRQIIFPKNI
jgi:hypothetical protein